METFCNSKLRLLFISIIAWPCLALGSAIPKEKSLTRIITTRYGRLQGYVLPLSNPLSPVEAFLGIPYAIPPLGINRFSPTRNPAPWQGIRMADRHSPACPQHLPNIANESEALQRMPKSRREYLLHMQSQLKNQNEDCLYLNIYSPFQGNAFILFPAFHMLLMHNT